jgi:hypothetical protein
VKQNSSTSIWRLSINYLFFALILGIPFACLTPAIGELTKSGLLAGIIILALYAYIAVDRAKKVWVSTKIPLPVIILLVLISSIAFVYYLQIYNLYSVNTVLTAFPSERTSQGVFMIILIALSGLLLGIATLFAVTSFRKNE